MKEVKDRPGQRDRRRALQVDVSNVDRALGTIFGSEITRQYPEGLPEDTFTISCNGSGGQSFGAFIPKGLTLELVGDSNDYFGKGLIRRQADRISAEGV